MAAYWPNPVESYKDGNPVLSSMQVSLPGRKLGGKVQRVFEGARGRYLAHSLLMEPGLILGNLYH